MGKSRTGASDLALQCGKRYIPFSLRRKSGRGDFMSGDQEDHEVGDLLAEEASCCYPPAVVEYGSPPRLRLRRRRRTILAFTFPVFSPIRIHLMCDATLRKPLLAAIHCDAWLLSWGTRLICLLKMG